MAEQGTAQAAAAMAWTLAGCPRRETVPAAAVPAVCAVCGIRSAQTVPATLTCGGKTFTDQHLLADRSSPRTCYGCAWAMAGRPPHAVRLWTVACAPGRDLGLSHPKSAAAVAGHHPGLLLTARNDMRAVAALLCSPPDGPWAVAVAVSGQKHTLPYTAVNHGTGRWRVRMDASDVHASPSGFADVLGRSAVLRQAGFTAAEIETLNPSAGRLTARSVPAWREHARALEPWRGSPLIRLANFMISKEHMDEYADRYRPS